MIRHNINLEKAVLAVKAAEEHAAREAYKQVVSQSHRNLARSIPSLPNDSSNQLIQGPEEISWKEEDLVTTRRK